MENFSQNMKIVDGVMAFYRKDESKCILVAANFGNDAATIKLKSEIEKSMVIEPYRWNGRL